MITKYILVVLSLYILFLVIGTKMVQKDRKKLNEDENENFYYGYLNNRKIFKKKPIISIMLDMVQIMLVFFIIFVIGVGIGMNEDIRKIWNGTGKYVDELAGIMFNLWITLIGILIVFVSFIKKTCLTFTSDDIIKRFRIKDGVISMGWCVLFCGGINFIKPMILFNNFKYSVYFGIRFLGVFIFVVFMYYFIKLSYILIESFFGDKMERIFLDSLYKELGYNSVRRIQQTDNWEDEGVVKSYLDYLIGQYLSFSKKIKLEQIHKIIYTSNLCMVGDRHKEQRYKTIKIRSIIFFIALYLVTMLPFFIIGIVEEVNNMMAIRQCIVLGIVLLIIVPVIFIFIAKYVESLAIFTIIIMSGRSCYEIIYKKDSKRILKKRYVKETNILPKTNCCNYVYAFESIITFYIIAPDNIKKIIEEELRKKCLYKLNEKEICLPLVAIGYLEYINKDEKLVNYDEIIEDDLVKRLTRAFCLDIGRRCYNCIEEEGIAKFDNYIEMRKESMK